MQTVNGPTWSFTTAATGVGPTISTQPQSQTIASGATATLSVSATGTAPLSYQWFQGTSGTVTTPVGTNSASFTTPALTTATNYWVRVTNTFGTANSNDRRDHDRRRAEHHDPPGESDDRVGRDGDADVFRPTGPALSYQWFQGTSGTTTTPVGTNSASFTTPALTTATNYWVRVTNTFGTANSNDRRHHDRRRAEHHDAPGESDDCLRAPPRRSLSKPNGTGLSYQWFQGTSGTTTTPVGTNSASFTTPALTTATNYWVRVTNTFGTANSNTAAITIGVGPSITTHPASQTIASGATATLTVQANGTGLSYQWFQGTSGTTTTPVGTNSASFTTPALTTATNYWVRVTNTFGTANSNTAAITIGVGPSITTHPASQTIASGATADAQCPGQRDRPQLSVVPGHQRHDHDPGGYQQRQLHDPGADHGDQLLGPRHEHVRHREFQHGRHHDRRRAEHHDAPGESDDCLRRHRHTQCPGDGDRPSAISGSRARAARRRPRWGPTAPASRRRR